MISVLRRPWVMMLLSVVLTILVMMPALKAPFFFDDNPNIVDNSAIHITSLNFESLKSSLNGSSAGPLGRPVSVLSFAITHYFFGLNAFAFKVINLGIHLINGVLLFWLMGLLLGKKSKTPYEWWPAWIAAIWLIHPINFLPVMLSVQRMTLLSALFMLLALISHLKSLTAHPKQKIAWFCLGWSLFWPLSVLSKETGLLFPLYIIVTTLLLNVDATSHISKNKNKKIVIFVVLLLLLMAAAAMIFMGKNWVDNAYSMRPFSLTQRLMTEARALWFYAGQIIFPNYKTFAIYHDDFLLSTSMLKPVTTLIAILALGAVVGFILLKWNRYTIICFSLGWFLVGHLMESTFLPLEIMHEHRNYFPSIGLIIFMTYFGVMATNKFKLIYRPKAIVVIVLTPIIILSFFTWMRATQLGSSLVGMQIEAAQHPRSSRANYSAALALFKAGYGASNDVVVGEKIKKLFERSGETDPSFKLGYLGLIVWACASERPVDSVWVQELSRRLEFEPFSPGEREIAKNLFDPLSSMPSCLNRIDIDRLFMAGSNNQKITVMQRVSFLEYAADYALSVWNDLPSTKIYLAKAMVIAPHTTRLEEKFKIVNKAKSSKQIEIDKQGK